MTAGPRIALALSGGGFRAAAFHLGGLDVLHRLGLLKHVRALSMVSGGSILGGRYARALHRGETFEQFYADTAAWLVRTHVLNAALEALHSPVGPPERTRAIITAAASVYARDDLLGDLRFGALQSGGTHVEEWIFNATEFHSGIAFRFQTSAHTDARIGNGNYWLERNAAADLRLADIAAASSCFPGAFEPMLFPRDFVGVEGSAGRARGEAFPESLALMDGGIHDNQGIEALLLAEQRAAPERPFDLFVISDSHKRSDAFLEVQPKAEATGPTLRNLFRMAEMLVALFGAGAGWLVVDALTNRETLAALELGVRALAAGLLLALSGGTVVAWRWIKAEVQRQIPEMSENLWRMLGELRTGEVLSLINLRVRSLLALTTSVFMKRIRGLSYERLFRTVGQARAVNNLIYDLEEAARHRVESLRPSPAQLEVARRAAAMPTALWFDRGEPDLRDLVACGQSTMCFNLLEHAHSHPEALDTFRAQLQALWEQLHADPYRLLDEGAERRPNVLAR